MSLNLNGPSPKKDTRMLAIGLAVAAAALLAFAAVSRMWIGRPDGIGFGPMGCTQCTLAGSGTTSNAAFVELMRSTVADEKLTSGTFAPMGWATFGLCLLGALGLLGGAALAFKQKRPDLPMAPTTLALMSIMLGLITGCVFIATKPGGPGFVGVQMGFWAFGIGAVMGIASAQMLAKINRPVDPDLLDGAMDPDQY